MLHYYAMEKHKQYTHHRLVIVCGMMSAIYHFPHIKKSVQNVNHVKVADC